MNNTYWKSGYIPFSFDGRDIPFDPEASGIDSVPLSQNDYLESPFGIRNQRSEEAEVPCCVSCAITSCIEIMDNELLQDETQHLSVLFHYYHARNPKNQLGSMTIRKGLKVASYKGICPIEKHPFLISKKNAMLKPSENANSSAKNNRILFDPVLGVSCYRCLRDIRKIDNWRAALRSKYPIIFGFWVTPSYLNISNSDPVHGPVDNVPSIGTGHAVLAVGYDDKVKQIIVQDSQGTKFGDKGYWYLPYSIVNFPGLIDQAWIIEKVIQK